MYVWKGKGRPAYEGYHMVLNVLRGDAAVALEQIARLRGDRDGLVEPFHGLVARSYSGDIGGHCCFNGEA